jgi:excisionase family DNA binding protein
MMNYKTPFMTVQEAAEYLRLKVSTIYHYVHHNKIAHYKLGFQSPLQTRGPG